MKTFKTPKGTELPLLNLKGKDYLQVQHRLVWFREERADWGIETQFMECSEKIAIAKATIRDSNGRIISQATKSETPAGFGDFIEKAESGAVGRALAMCGFGTQFTVDLDEGERIVDSPVDPRANAPVDPGSAIMTIGKNKGMRLDAIGPHDLNSWLNYMSAQPELSPRAKEMMAQVENFLDSRSPKAGSK